MPDDVREMWLTKEIQAFNQSRLSDTYSDFFEIVPIPPKYFYPDGEKNAWTQTDLIREVDKYYNNDFKKQ